MILVAGDSYSDSCYSTRTCQVKNGKRFSWVELLRRDYTIKCVAQSGSSNKQIVSQIKRSKQCDYLIVNLSSLARPAKWFHRDRGDIVKVIEQNFKIAQGLAKRPNTLCWTPYPGYEDIDEVHYIPLEQHNELYNEAVKKTCTQHHMDATGNLYLYQWMRERLRNEIVDSLVS